MVWTVRCASLTARPATSVERVACSAISPIEAASSSTEPAAAVTLPEATPTRCSAVRASAETSSAALLSWVEVISRRLRGVAQLGQHLVDRCLEAGDGGGDGLAALLALALGGGLARGQAARARSWCRGTPGRCAPSRRARRAAWVAGMRAEMSPAASRFMASASPLSGRVMLRPIHQLNTSPIRTAPQPTQTMNCLVRACDDVSAADAAAARCSASSMILSACGPSPAWPQPCP